MRTLFLITALLLGPASPFVGHAHGQDRQSAPPAASAEEKAVSYQPGDVRPWAAYVAARKAVQTASPRDIRDAPRMMLALLGPLPWRFEVEADTPFTSPAVVNQMFSRAEDDGFHRVWMARAKFEYPGNKGWLDSEDRPIFGIVENIGPREDGSKYLDMMRRGARY